MAIAYVTGNTGYNDGSGSTIAAGAISSTSGNCIIVGVTCYNSPARTVQSIADTAGNSYEIMGSVENFGDSYWRQEVWIAQNITGNASNVVTVTYTGAALYRYIIAIELSGVALTNANDTGYAIANIDTSTPYSPGSDSTASDNECLILWAVEGAGNATTYSNGTGTVRHSITAGEQDCCMATRIVTTAGSYSIDVAGTASRTICCIARAVKPAAEAPPSGNPWYYYAQQLRSLKDKWRGLLQIPSLEEVKMYGRERYAPGHC